MRKEELKQIILDPKWTERREAQKKRSEKNSQAAKKWKAREQALLEQVKDLMKENIKRQHHFLNLKDRESQKPPEKTIN